ncbi:hypothetical protein B0H66DRAFT_629635 [Apodospora peruviana]|uniref:Uncharacterized protein n=1 Tax=Apodospora peruviana TaxID=516989 RepID=A0AAE0HVI6_9PEZI|nr:hypothetical protein B0H66DRAFT_629635 [Apodospora peruviana]
MTTRGQRPRFFSEITRVRGPGNHRSFRAPGSISYFDSALHDLAIRAGMKCIVVRHGPHNRRYIHDKSTAGRTLVTITNNKTGGKAGGHRLVTTDYHVTLLMGAALDSLQVQGHVYTEFVPRPEIVGHMMNITTMLKDPKKLVKLEGEPGTGEPCTEEFWICSRNLD